VQLEPKKEGAGNVERAQAGVILVKPPRNDHQILRAKLKWGQG